MSKYPYIINNKCKNCNGDIIAKRSRDKENMFCSTGCVGKYFRTKKKEYVKCEYCEKEFLKTSKTTNKYCSRKCSGKGKIKEYELNCLNCNNKFILNNKAEINRGGGKYCSIKCSGEHRREYKFDYEYFNKIDSEDKAYWLGFLYADGNIYNNELTLKLTNIDYEHIVKFNKSLNSTYKIHKADNNTSYVKLYHKNLKENMNKVGIHPNKTFTIKYPKIDSKLDKHFIRGFFDGDGSVYLQNNKYLQMSLFTASENFKKSLIEKIPIEFLEYEQYNGYHLRLCKRELVEKFYNYIYPGNIYLKRKKDKFDIFFK